MNMLNINATSTIRKALFCGFSFTLLSLSGAFAQASLPTSTTASSTKSDQDVINISKKKWQWMANKQIDSLGTLFDNKAVFVHMGGSWGKEQELSVIKSGNIWYRKADVYGVSVNRVGNTAILLNDIDLVAVVGGN